MQGVLPFKEDTGFKISGKQFHVGAFGDSIDDLINIALVAEKTSGGGVYNGPGAHNTWEFVHLFDAALFKAQNPNADERTIMQTFVNEANVKLETYIGGSGGQVPQMPADIILALQWFCKYKIQFRSDTNQIILS
jgi:hypothetical protein